MQIQKEIIKTDLHHYAFGYGDKDKLFKLMFWNDKDRCHYTILFNDYKKEIDFHKTVDVPEKHYLPILKISYYTCIKLLAIHQKAQIRLLNKYCFSHKITVGKLVRLDAFLLPTDNPYNEDVFINKKKKKKFRLQSHITVSDLEDCFMHPSEVMGSDSDSFIVYFKKNARIVQLGTIIKSKRQLFLISNDTFTKFSHEMVETVKDALTSHTFNSREKLLSFLA